MNEKVFAWEAPKENKEKGVQEEIKTKTLQAERPVTFFERKDLNNPIIYNPNILVISQSLIKQITNHHQEMTNPCPLKVYHTFIKQDMESYQSDSMRYGSYFETECLGYGRNGKRTGMHEGGRDRHGNPKAEYRKINFQVSRFKQICQMNKLDIKYGWNTQIRIFKKWSSQVILVGDLDIFPAIMVHNGATVASIIDLKLTGNINTTYGQGWGSSNHRDHIQADIYYQLVRDIDFALNDDYNPGNHLRELFEGYGDIYNKGYHKFFYWIFGYHVREEDDLLNAQFKEVERVVDNTKISETNERIRKTIDAIEEMKKNGWVAKEHPDYHECKHCPVNIMNGGTCLKAETIERV